MRPRILEFWRIGEPTGDGAITAPEPPPASDPEPPASEPEAPASEPESAPAEEEGAPPAEPEPEAPAAPELTAEDRREILEALRGTPEYDEFVQQDAPKPKAEPEPARVRAADPFYSAITTQANDSYQRISAASQKLANGELESVDDLLADIAVTGAWQAASERRGHIAVNRAVVERALGIEDGKLETGNELHTQYDDLLTALETTQQNAYRLRGQAVREYDAQKRSDYITRAEIMDANAVGDFYNKTINLAMEKGKLDGKADAEKAFGRRAPALAEQARTNGHTEAIAKARANVLAGKAQASASVPTLSTSDRSIQAVNHRIANNEADAEDKRIWKARYQK